MNIRRSMLKLKVVFIGILFVSQNCTAQLFLRSELPAILEIPWELTCAPDGNLWISESQGRVVKVNPQTGVSLLVYQAPDYADADTSEISKLCFHPKMGSGCLGLALHPDFLNDSNFIYLFYSYHNIISSKITTCFKIVKLTLNQNLDAVVSSKDLVVGIPSGFDHLGGRMIAVKTHNQYYLFVSIGDHGISEESNPDCYSPASNNPNNQAQNPTTLNGKILRYHLDGSIPADNPLPGNPFYTRGHRNPQGLVWNSRKQILYEIEHGDRTDDEVNILEKGMNYGWKTVRGYHGDNNYPGEQDSFLQFSPYPGIAGDRLVDPIYAWCHGPQPASPNYLDWCTIAPSDGALYQSSGIPFLSNCLIVTTLKSGNSTFQQLYILRLSEDGYSLAQDAINRPAVFTLFEEDSKQNGRLRDVAFSPDGKTIYLINNGGVGSGRDKVIQYSYIPNQFKLYPNPTMGILNVECTSPIQESEIYNQQGEEVKVSRVTRENQLTIETEFLPSGVYFIRCTCKNGEILRDKWVKL